VLNRGLLKEYPNPDRVGCPGSDVVRKIASGEMPLSEADKWLDHLGSCSPCYRDFLQFHAVHRARRKQTMLAIAASVLIVASLAGWAVLRNQKKSLVAQTAVVDLRNRSTPRGAESDSSEPPVEINRATRQWNIYLPLGSSEGPYELSITSLDGHPVLTGSGSAMIKDGITSLYMDVDLNATSPGQYVLQLRKVGSGWVSYPLRVR
jgi:hypothetical protein